MRIAFLSQLCTNVYFPEDLPEGEQYHPVASRPGGPAVGAVSVMRALGSDVSLFGWYTQDDDVFRQQALAGGIHWEMEFQDGRGAINVVLQGPRILRVIPGPPCTPLRRAIATLVSTRPHALALSGTLPGDTVETWLTTAAALGIPCFWDAPGHTDLDVIGSGATVYLQASYAEHVRRDAGQTPSELARALAARTGAAGVIVTAAERGAFGILREDGRVFHAPAVVLDAPQTTVGCGDAHFAGFLTTFLQAPQAHRLVRGLEVGRLVAARHACALAPGGWRALREFEEGQARRIPTILLAA